MKVQPFTTRVMRLLLFAGLIMSLLVTSLPARNVAAIGGPNRFVGPTGNDNNTNDCTSNITPCLTISYAITKANSNDSIEIAIGVYNEKLYIDKNLTFEGAGIQGVDLTTTLDGGGSGPVITIPSSYTVSFKRIIIQNGNNDLNGGGILNQGGLLSLERVKVVNNVANNGAGIYSTGPLNLTDVVISGNNSNKNSTSSGGGIYLDQSGAASLSRVTLSGNTAIYSSGGIHHQGGGTLNLTNVTISGNTADKNGAMTNAASSTASLLNSTIANNHVVGTGAAVGGIANIGTINFKNTLIAGNDDVNCSLSSGSWTSLGNNLDSGSTCDFTQTGDLQNTNPILGPLSGGPYDIQFQVHTLLTGSPAINTGTNIGCPDTDEWGINRPVGAFCDIGASEFGYISEITQLLNSVLPTSRSVTVGTTATIFNSVINAKSLAANNVVLYMASPPAGIFAYQQTDCATNTVMGPMNPVLNLPGNSALCYILFFTPSAPFAATNVHIRAVADNAPATGLYTGINTWLLRATSVSGPDIIALTTTTDFHQMAATGTNAFAVALANVGAVASQLTVVADDGGISWSPLPLTITVNETNQGTGAVIGDNVLENIGAGETRSVAIFVTFNNGVAFDPARNRIFVRFVDGSGNVVGSTSTAVSTGR